MWRDLIYIAIFAIWFIIGIVTYEKIYVDTGAYCMSMYHEPEDISECLWIMNRKEQV
jgi:hypothetical protein